MSIFSFFSPTCSGRAARHEVTDQCRKHDDERKWRVEEEDCDEGRTRDPVEQRRFQRTLANAQQRFDHDHQHGSLDAEQRTVDPRDATPKCVKKAQAEHEQRARQHEQDAGRKAAAHAVQRPTDVGRELLRLRPRQQHAEVERMQEARLVEPFLLVDDHAVHHGDLRGRTAEVDASDLQPQPERFAETRRSVRGTGQRLAVGPPSHAAFAGQLCRSSAA